MSEADEDEAQRWLSLGLVRAAWRGDVNGCVALINHGVSPSVCVCGTTPLHEASRRGHHRVTQLLLQYHANTQAIDRNGLTPFEVHRKRYNWFRNTSVYLTVASHNAYVALYRRTQEERAAAAEAARASWRADNPQKMIEFDTTREALEAQVERNEITEGHFVEQMNALRDEYIRCCS